MSTEKSLKVPVIFSCISCHYNTSHKRDYEKHVLTDKHKKHTLSTFCQPKNTYFCFCGKKYSERSGLWRHKKICNFSLCDEQKSPEIQICYSKMKM